MIVNKHVIGSSKFNNFCANIDYSLVEIVNYIFIVIQNILILWRFYKRTDLPYEEYYSFDQKKVRKLHPENLVIAIIQSCFLIVFLIIWYIFKFMNSCQYYIMYEYNKQFVGKRIGEDEIIPQLVVDYFQGKNISTTSFFREVNKNLTKWERFYVYVFCTHLLNREIIMLVLSLILNIFYIITINPLFLFFQVLFISNIISTLFDIIYAIKLKWKNIVLLLLFDFLCVYIFMWFAFFFYPYFFVFDEVRIPASQEDITEGFCFSSVQCYLFILARGSLSNGGISNDLKRIDIYFRRSIQNNLRNYKNNNVLMNSNLNINFNIANNNNNFINVNNLSSVNNAVQLFVNPDKGKDKNNPFLNNNINDFRNEEENVMFLVNKIKENGKIMDENERNNIYQTIVSLLKKIVNL